MPAPTIHISMMALDVAAAQTYLRGLESLAKEASETSDPRVLVTALKVISVQRKTVSQLGVNL
jgi:hypothetical protein